MNLDRFGDVIGRQRLHLAVFQHDSAVQTTGEGARPNQQLCVHAIKCVIEMSVHVTYYSLVAKIETRKC